MRLLLIEDDQMIGETLSLALRNSGYAVDWATDGEMGEESLHTGSYSLVLLDLGLPKLCGIDVLKRMRLEKNPVPVLILTARDQVEDRVEALNLGADDYLIKPFVLAEMEARIRALLRRYSGQANPLLVNGTMTLNTITKEICYKNKSSLLSAREYALMFILMEVPGKLLSRAQLEEKLYGWKEDISSNAVEVHIHSLRRKFDTRIIRNIRGMGYMVEKQ